MLKPMASFDASSLKAIPVDNGRSKGASVVGVFWGDFARLEPQANAAAMAELLQWYAQGKIKPVIDRSMPAIEIRPAPAR
jgi:NADPH2:quinone reductase